MDKILRISIGSNLVLRVFWQNKISRTVKQMAKNVDISQVRNIPWYISLEFGVVLSFGNFICGGK